MLRGALVIVALGACTPGELYVGESGSEAAAADAGATPNEPSNDDTPTPDPSTPNPDPSVPEPSEPTNPNPSTPDDPPDPTEPTDPGQPEPSEPSEPTPPPTEPGPVDPGPGPTGPAPSGFGLVEGLRLSSIAVFQGVKVTVVDGGAEVASRNAPIIAGRRARIRAYVEPTSGWSSRQVMAQLNLTSGGSTQSFTDEKTISGASDETRRATLFEFDVPGRALDESTEIEVMLLVQDGADAATAGPHEARFPRSGGSLALGAQSNEGIDIVVVPIRYGGDGSNRLPDTSEPAMTALRDHFHAVMPTSEVRLTVREAVTYDGTVSARSSGGWSSLLNGLMNLRAEDNPTRGAYYLGLFNPASSFQNYCGGACIAGIAPRNDRNAESQRVGLALGYADETNRFSAIHEIGHAHGRPHAPCGSVADADGNFPHSRGTIGVVGWDMRDDVFYSRQASDMMGYCDPKWVSDYTFEHLARRIAATASSQSFSAERIGHHLVTLAPFTAPIWGNIIPEVPARVGDGGDIQLVEALDRNGRSMGQFAAHEYELSDGVSTNFLIPQVSGAAAFRFANGGPTLRLPTGPR